MKMTIVFWAMNSKDTYEDLFAKMLFEQSDQMNSEQTEQMLKNLLSDAGKGTVSRKRLQSLDMIDPDVDFYMLGTET